MSENLNKKQIYNIIDNYINNSDKEGINDIKELLQKLIYSCDSKLEEIKYNEKEYKEYQKYLTNKEENKKKIGDKYNKTNIITRSEEDKKAVEYLKDVISKITNNNLTVNAHMYSYQYENYCGTDRIEEYIHIQIGKLFIYINYDFHYDSKICLDIIIVYDDDIQFNWSIENVDKSYLIDISDMLKYYTDYDKILKKELIDSIKLDFDVTYEQKSIFYDSLIHILENIIERETEHEEQYEEEYDSSSDYDKAYWD